MSQQKHSVKTPPQKAWAGAILKGFIVFFSWLPLRLNRALGGLIGRILWWFNTGSRKVVTQNIQAVYPEYSKAEQNQLIKDNLIETGKMITELGPAWRWSSERLLPLIKKVEGQQYLDAAVAKNKGVIFLAPHIGSWELIGPYLSTQYPSTFLYRPPNVPSIESFMVKSRARFGATLAPTDMRGVRTLIQALKANQVTGILPDQDPGKRGSVYAPFFGRAVRTMTLTSKLIQKTDAAFVYIVMERLPGSKGYKLHFIPAEEAIASMDDVEATTALNRGVEACIAIAPAQYLWSYKRFRHPKEGEQSLYTS